MGEKEVDSPRAAIEEVEAEAPDPGAGVEHKGGPVVKRDLDARRVSPVAKGVRPRCRHRSATTPDRQAHGDLTLLTPEDRHDPDELVRMREQRERGHRDLTLDPVHACDPKSLVRRAPLVEGDPCWPPLERQGIGVECSGLEPRRPFLLRHLTDLGKSATEDCLGSLVVEDEPAALVGDQGRRRKIRREFTSENENEVLLARLAHGPRVRLPRLAPGETPMGSARGPRPLGHASAFCLIESYSARLIAPLSSSFFARSISTAAPPRTRKPSAVV